MFDSSEEISILCCLLVSHITENSNIIHKGSSIGLVHFYEESNRSCSDFTHFCPVQAAPIRMLHSHQPVESVDYLLATYATNDVFAKDDLDIMNFKQPTDQSAVDHSQGSGRDPYAASYSTMSTAWKGSLLKNEDSPSDNLFKVFHWNHLPFRWEFVCDIRSFTNLQTANPKQ